MTPIYTKHVQYISALSHHQSFQGAILFPQLLAKIEIWKFQGNTLSKGCNIIKNIKYAQMLLVLRELLGGNMNYRSLTSLQR